MTKTFEELWAGLDTDKIAETMFSTGIKDYELEDAKSCVYDAAHRWLLWDLENFVITGLEECWKSTDPEIQALGGFKSYLDITGYGSDDLGSDALKGYKGQRIIIDWKTSKNALDKKWKDRQVMSHQWRMYAYLADARLFMYRGIQRPDKDGVVSFREVNLDVTAEVREGARQQIITVMSEIAALNEKKVAPWPQSMPNACYMYNRECAFLSDCDLYKTAPAQILKPHEHSYTRLQHFMTCSELYRREMLLLESDTEEDIDSTQFGKAVHAGLAEVYSQATGVVVQGRG